MAPITLKQSLTQASPGDCKVKSEALENVDPPPVLEVSAIYIKEEPEDGTEEVYIKEEPLLYGNESCSTAPLSPAPVYSSCVPCKTEAQVEANSALPKSSQNIFALSTNQILKNSQCSVVEKRTAIVELFKAGNSKQDISKSLEINRMLVWRTIKRYEETGDVHNRPGQGRPRTVRTPKLIDSTREKIRRNPKRTIQKLAKQSNVSYGTMSTVLRKDLMLSPIQACQKTPTVCSSC